jgi:hypothetical protein
LPPDAAATPASGTVRESRLLNAPRGLNGAGVLQELELERHRMIERHAEVARRDAQHRRATHMVRDARMRGADVVCGDRHNGTSPGKALLIKSAVL